MPGAPIRSARQIARMRRAARVVAEMHERVAAAARPGVSTATLEAIAREVIHRRAARSNFLGYNGYPAVICTSPNDLLAYGVPGEYRLREGDLLTVDCGAMVDGFHADGSFTMAVGGTTREGERLVAACEAGLWAAIAEMRPGKRLHRIGSTIDSVARREGFAVVREYVGHGIGRALHEEPKVPNYWPGRHGPVLRPGMVFAVEPMLAAGSSRTRVLDDGWGVATADGSLAAHFGHNVLVTEDGPEVLTAPG